MGDLVAGRYRLGRPLGSGGSADVRAATDELLGRAVAVKLARDRGDALLDQARACAVLDHPHVVRVLDAGRHGGRAFLVLDLVDGVTLAEVAGPLPVPDALAVLDGVLAALDHAHEHGVLHLDLSTTNVMLARGEDGRPRPDAARLLDLGGTRPLDGLVAVSPHYASPEVASGRAGDARSDLYSAGALLHELVTGRPPFADVAPADLLQAHVDREPPRPSATADVPPVVDAIVATALAKRPADRFPHAAAMRAAVVAAHDRSGSSAALLAAPRADAPGPTPVLPLALRAGAPPAGPDARASGHRADVGARTAAWRGDAPGPSPAQGELGPSPARVELRPSPARGALEPNPAQGALRATADPAPRPALPPPASAGTRVAWSLAVAALVGVAVLGGSALSRGGDAAAGTPPAVASATATTTPRTSATPTARATPRAASAPTPPAAVDVPALAGRTLDDARATLAAAGLLLGAVEPVDGPTPGGTVVATRPSSGQVAPGTAVDVDVASGSTGVPDVAGLGQAAAETAIRDAGAEPVVRPVTGPPGVAVGTFPAGGTRVPVGSQVELLVGPAAGPTPSPTPTASPSPTRTPLP